MFDGKNYRTTKMDILARHIFQIKSDLDKNKKRKSEQISCFSCFVPSAGIEPARLAALEFESSIFSFPLPNKFLNYYSILSIYLLLLGI